MQARRLLAATMAIIVQVSPRALSGIAIVAAVVTLSAGRVLQDAHAYMAVSIPSVSSYMTSMVVITVQTECSINNNNG